MSTCALTGALSEAVSDVSVSTLMNVVSIQVPWASALTVKSLLEELGLPVEQAGQETLRVLGIPDKCTVTAWSPASEGPRLLSKVLVPLDAPAPGELARLLAMPDVLVSGVIGDSAGRRARQDVMRQVDALIAVTPFGLRVQLDRVEETLAVLIGDVLGVSGVETYEHWVLEDALTKLAGPPDLITVARAAAR